MEIKINKEIRDYQESIIMGLSARQFLFSAAAVAAAVGVYFTLKKSLCRLIRRIEKQIELLI